MPVIEDASTKAFFRASVIVTFFRASVIVTIENGSSTLFWTECRLDGQGNKELAPDLFAAVLTRHRNSRMVWSALNGNSWLRDIVGPLTLPVIIQYIKIRALIDDVALSNQEDSVAWKWSTTGSSLEGRLTL
jgi:hypothetical protein